VEFKILFQKLTSVVYFHLNWHRNFQSSCSGSFRLEWFMICHVIDALIYARTMEFNHATWWKADVCNRMEASWTLKRRWIYIVSVISRHTSNHNSEVSWMIGYLMTLHGLQRLLTSDWWWSGWSLSMTLSGLWRERSCSVFAWNNNNKTKLNSVAFSLQANYIDRATAACRRS
jgi:hypothetical protein